MFGRKAAAIRYLNQQLNLAEADLRETRSERDDLARMCSDYHDRNQRLHDAYKHLQQRMLTLHPDPPTGRAYLLDPPVEQWRQELLGGAS